MNRLENGALPHHWQLHRSNNTSPICSESTSLLLKHFRVRHVRHGHTAVLRSRVYHGFSSGTGGYGFQVGIPYPRSPSYRDPLLGMAFAYGYHLWCCAAYVHAC